MDANDIKEAASAAIKAVDPKKLKPGMASSELYVVAGTILSTLLTSAFGLPIPAELMISLVTLAGTYLASRTFLKAKEAGK
jgi:hypothetical protein